MTTTMIATTKGGTVPAHGGQVVVWKSRVAGFPVILMQDRKRQSESFSVQYGQQLDHNLTYSEAASKLGQALMHGLACEGLLDNERD